ncbi:hypothetical protein AB0L64_06050 [Kribbella sp. NPDC051936]|uniref:hypothetical protein n=1 Tax=Kribbella sp. NPDC051936 TaxID=3154946 RepID=UPI00344719B2
MARLKAYEAAEDAAKGLTSTLSLNLSAPLIIARRPMWIAELEGFGLAGPRIVGSIMAVTAAAMRRASRRQHCSTRPGSDPAELGSAGAEPIHVEVTNSDCARSGALSISAGMSGDILADAKYRPLRIGRIGSKPVPIGIACGPAGSPDREQHSHRQDDKLEFFR